MEKETLLEILKSKNVITKNNKRKFCWKTYFTDDVKNEFLNFSKNYRTDEEAWFCLLNNIVRRRSSWLKNSTTRN